MRLYSGTTRTLIDDTTRNQIAGKLSDSFFYHFRYQPPQSEVKSWRESLRAISQVFQAGGLLDHGVLLELQLPHSSKRLDCLVTGKDRENKQNGVIVELEQWQGCRESEAENLVETWVGGGWRDVPHPSVQVDTYRSYLKDYHTAFDDGGVALHGCAYLHNYEYNPDDALHAAKFSDTVARCPTFTGDEVDDLIEFLRPPLVGGDGAAILGDIDQGSYRPSKNLLKHLKSVIEGNPEFWIINSLPSSRYCTPQSRDSKTGARRSSL
jgi:hypothetical protein